MHPLAVIAALAQIALLATVRTNRLAQFLEIGNNLRHLLAPCARTPSI